MRNIEPDALQTLSEICIEDYDAIQSFKIIKEIDDLLGILKAKSLINHSKGRKSNVEKRFTMGSNVVYVILKGTKDVVGYFTVLSMSPVRINDAVRCNNLICTDVGWLAKYLDYGNQKGYLWEVGDVNVFFPHSKNIVDLHLKSNPQSFCYIK